MTKKSYEIENLLSLKSNEIMCHCKNEIVYVLNHQGQLTHQIESPNKIKNMTNSNEKDKILILFKNGNLTEFKVTA